MPGKWRWLVIALVAALTTFGLGTTAGADSAAEGEFLALINSSRASNGLGPLSVDGGIRAHARNHTDDMIAAGEIFHSTSGELQAAAGSGWEKLGENVGRGGTPSSLHNAFMGSSGHRANILGDYNKVGIGVDYDGEGVMYVTVVFMKKGGSSTTTTTAPPATTTTSQGGSAGTTSGGSSSGGTPAPTTTAPATTTTTMVVGPDKPVTPGESCIEATRFFWTCHD